MFCPNRSSAHSIFCYNEQKGRQKGVSMNIQQCRYVEAIAKAGSFTEAAKQLYLTQPNLSAAIKDLEKELGVSLFSRSNKGAKLTEHGHDFLKYAKRILGEINLLENRYKTSFQKTFTLAAHHYDFLSLPLTRIAHRFQDNYKAFELIETTTKKILDSVHSFESDLGIIYLNADNEQLLQRQFKEMDLTFTPLGQYPTRVFLGKQHPLATKTELTNQDLIGYPQVRFKQDTSGINFDEDTLTILENQQIFYCNDRGSVMNILGAGQAYASGLGIVTSFIKDQIVLIPLKDSPLHTLGYVTNKKQQESPLVQALIDEIKQSLQTAQGT